MRVIGRRQVELYSRLIHTVDHVEGILRPEFDALDAFLSHTWAVTVTGAPKHWAIRFIEANERSARRWYGGAIGRIGFDGAMNTGLTLRTVRMKDGIAEIRAGATLLYDSDPDAEDDECPAQGLSAVHGGAGGGCARTGARTPGTVGDCACACCWWITRIPSSTRSPTTCGRPAPRSRRYGPSPRAKRCATARPISSCSRRVPAAPRISAPPRPSRWCWRRTCRSSASASASRPWPSIFGGRLDQLDEPVHGKPSEVKVKGTALFRGLPARFQVGRYHSLYARRVSLPDDLLRVTAETDDGVVMALEHRARPIAAVQFHPESILSLDDGIGMRLIDNMVTALTGVRTDGG